MPRSNRELAGLFQQMADINDILGGNRFKSIAYQKAARVVGELDRSVTEIDPGDLKKVEGIGGGTADRIAEYLDTGEIADHQKLLAKVPAGLTELLDISGLGPKSVALLWKEAGVENRSDLAAKLETDELAGLKGFGKKTIENIKKSLAFMDEAGKRHRIGTADGLAGGFLEALGGLPGVQRIEPAGSLRRGKETIGDLDILVAADASDAGPIFEAFATHDRVTDVLLRGETKCSVRTDIGMQVDLRVVSPDAFGAALMYFTGSKDHNVKMRQRALDYGYTLNEYALADKDDKAKVIAAKTEEDVFKALGLAWVPPELREDRGELKLAEADDIPELITLDDIQAELHTHTTASDGTWSIEDNALAAAARGFHTVAITDHSKGQVQANGLSNKRLENHIVAVREVAAKLKGKIRVLAGSEVDILADGKLDYPDSLLAELDIVVASPHAALSQDPKKATTRLLKAIENPYVTILGHPTGRLILRREGLSPDIPELCQACAERGIAMEINANHYRLDLRDTHARTALDCGCKLAINTDAHGPADLDQLRYGVLTARRSGASADDVVNTYSQEKLKAWIEATRAS
ncbi:MAG: DNA polymerase/3'-5' exonuclease PolX [Planctomycetota bacterium]